MKGILGRKAGMTTAFSEAGHAIPVTVVEVKPNTVLQVKTKAANGYVATQLGVEDKKEQRATKAELGNAKKANTTAKYFIREIRDMGGYDIGQTIDASIFTAGELVDVTGISKGKGFQGAIKRHNQSRGPMGHGSKSHRVTGSLGDIRGTVKKTKKMPGHMGTDQVTMQNLEIIAADVANNVLLIRGSIPGPAKGFVWVREANKGQGKSTKQPVKLVNVQEETIKNKLIEQGHKVGALLNSTMQIEEMKQVLADATIAHDKQQVEHEAMLIEAKKIGITNYKKLSSADLKSSIEKTNIALARKAAKANEGNK